MLKAKGSKFKYIERWVKAGFAIWDTGTIFRDQIILTVDRVR